VSIQPDAVIETPEALKARLDAPARGIVTVKPRVFFRKVEEAFQGPVQMDLFVPSSAIGSITLLEGAIMVSLLKLLRPARVFEFGTFLGYSSSLMLKNTDPSCEVHTIDLGDDVERYREAEGYSDAELHADDKKNDDYLRFTQGTKGAVYLADLPERDRGRLTVLRGDSTQLDVAGKGYSGAFDLVFIDGGHDAATIASDTRKALEMIGGDGVIVWHDYNSTIHSDVTDFMAGFAKDQLVLHVQSTMFAVLLAGDARTRFLDIAA
jgi:predicted O-methyltransferase YrrM